MKTFWRTIICLTMLIISMLPAAAYAHYNSDIMQVSCGGAYTGIIKNDGSLWMTGGNYQGQLGDGTNDNKSVPVKIMDNVAQVCCGLDHTAIIDTDGNLWMTGENNYGQLGDGTKEDKNIPVRIPDMNDVVQVSCGFDYTAILKKDGSLYMTGGNKYGEFANNTETSSTIPVKVMDDVAQVSCGAHHTGILTKDGTLYSAGSNEYGQLGQGTWKPYNRSDPVEIMNDVSKVSCGSFHTGILTKDGQLYMAGDNQYGQIGVGNDRTEPDLRWVMDGVSDVNCGVRHTGILTNDGKLLMAGNNINGEFGNNSNVSIDIPIEVMGDVAQVSCGNWHTGIIKNDGSLWMTGGNSYGELGVKISSDKTFIPKRLTIGFTLGVHNNSWDHHYEEGAGFEGISDYNFKGSDGEKYLEKLMKKATLGEALYIVKTIFTKEWNGSCYGLLATMGLSYRDYIELKDIVSNPKKASSYYSIARPCDDDHLLNVIQYYYFSQYVSAANNKIEHKVMNKNDYSLLDRLDVNTDLKSFFEDLIERVSNEEIVLLGVLFQDAGHALLVTGHRYDPKKGKHILDLYDVNEPDKDEFFEMTIDSDLKHFYLDCSHDKLTESSFRGLYFVDWSSMLDLDGNVYCESFQGGRIAISGTSDVRISSKDGKYLQYSGGKLSGNMNIYDMTPMISGEDTELVIYTDDIDEYEVSDITGDVNISVSSSKGFSALRGTGIQYANIILGEETYLIGDEFHFDLYSSTNSMVRENQPGMVSFEGDCKGAVAAYVEDDSVRLDTGNVDYIVNNLKATQHVGIDHTTKEYDGVIQSITVADHTHSFGKWKKVKAASEIAAGKKTRTCSVCGLKKTKVIPQLVPTLKAVRIIKPKAAKKSAIVKWKKIKKNNIKKVQIQYSTNKNFKKGVKTKYSSAKKTSYKIKNLKKGKKYYIRIRAYTKSGSKVHVSKWSRIKTVRAK